MFEAEPDIPPAPVMFFEGNRRVLPLGWRHVGSANGSSALPRCPSGGLFGWEQGNPAAGRLPVHDRPGEGNRDDDAEPEGESWEDIAARELRPVDRGNRRGQRPRA